MNAFHPFPSIVAINKSIELVNQQSPQQPTLLRNAYPSNVSESSSTTPSPVLQHPIVNNVDTSNVDSGEDQIVSLNVHDVICGRSKESFGHPGNAVFRKLVRQHSTSYQQTTAREVKRHITHQVVGAIRGIGGRFLRLDDACTHLVQTNDSYVYDKVSHALRSSRKFNTIKSNNDTAKTTRKSGSKKRPVVGKTTSMNITIPQHSPMNVVRIVNDVAPITQPSSPKRSSNSSSTSSVTNGSSPSLSPSDVSEYESLRMQQINIMQRLQMIEANASHLKQQQQPPSLLSLQQATLLPMIQPQQQLFRLPLLPALTPPLSTHLSVRLVSSSADDNVISAQGAVALNTQLHDQQLVWPVVSVEGTDIGFNDTSPFLVADDNIFE